MATILNNKVLRDQGFSVFTTKHGKRSYVATLHRVRRCKDGAYNMGAVLLATRGDSRYYARKHLNEAIELLSLGYLELVEPRNGGQTS